MGLSTIASGSVQERVATAFLETLEENVDASYKRVRAAAIPYYMALPEAAAKGAYRRAFQATAQDLGLETPVAFPALLSALGTQRSQMGVVISDVLRGIALGFEVASQCFAARFRDDPEALVFWEQSRARISYVGAAALADAYVSAREQVVNAQAQELAELSVRVLPLYPGILVLPLVGRIDAKRAAMITTTLLEAIATHASRVVLMDLTGLAFVDADVAAHLLAAAQAAELLGTTPLLVGVGPSMAKTMIEAGVDLGRVKTLSNLAAGLRHALRLLGKAIVDSK